MKIEFEAEEGSIVQLEGSEETVRSFMAEHYPHVDLEKAIRL